MTKLEQFLIENIPGSERVNVQLAGDKYKNFPFVIKPVTHEKYKEITSRVTSYPTKQNQTVQFDLHKMQILMIIESCVEPNFKSEEFQTALGFPRLAEECVKKVLLPGHIATLYQEIQKLSGFDVGMSGLVKEAKN